MNSMRLAGTFLVEEVFRISNRPSPVFAGSLDNFVIKPGTRLVAQDDPQTPFTVMGIDRHCGKGWATNKIGILFTEDPGDKIRPGARLHEYRVARLQEEPSDPELLDVVVLTRGRPEKGLVAGVSGTVVEIFDCPRRAYEVEFIADDGGSVAIVTLLPEEIRPA